MQDIFEIHLTVDCSNTEELSRFAETCSNIGAKPVLIELPQGPYQRQLMTSSYHRGDEESALAHMHALADRLHAAGLRVRRRKLEMLATPHNTPQEDWQARQAPLERYFEFHIKTLLQGHEEFLEAKRISQKHQAHLSRNAFRRAQEKEERFITLRLRDIGLQRSLSLLRALKDDLARAGVRTIKTLKEYIIYDDREELDSAWIKGENTQESRTPPPQAASPCTLQDSRG